MNQSPAATTRSRTTRSILGFLIFCELASGFTQGYYSPLLPDIARSLSVSDSGITWFLSVQALAAAVCVPLMSRLGDMYGHRRILRIAMVAVTLGVIVIALAPSYPVVLAARVLHGGIAVWLPLEIAIVHGQVRGEQARRAVGLLVSFLTAGAILGTVAAGVVDAISPSLRVTLLFPLVLLAVSLYAAFFRIPESPSLTPSRIDGVGFAGLAATMVALFGGLSMLGDGASAVTWAVLGLGVALLAAFARWERRTSAPAIDVDLVLSRRTGPIHLAGFLFGMVMFGSQAPLTTFLSADPDTLGYGFDKSAGTISLVIAALTLFATFGAAGFATLAHRIGVRAALVVGAALPLLANLTLLALHETFGFVWVFAIVSGLGMGMLLGGLPAVLAEVTPDGEVGQSVGVYNALRALGGAFGGAVFAVVLRAWTVSGEHHADLAGYLWVWGLCAVVFLTAVVAIVLLRLPEDTHLDPAPTH